MLRNEFLAFSANADLTAATSVRGASVAAASGDAGSTDFSATFGAIRADVMDFIENGSQGGLPSMPSLSVEGSAYMRDAQAGQLQDASAAGSLPREQREFLSSIAPWTQETGKLLGVSPEIVAAHAALESGWGQRPLKQANGGDTNNLFGIKAGSGWRGDVAQAVTTEYEDGGAVPKVAQFRSYLDRGSAFHDYAQLLLTDPRYRSALNTGGDARAFAQGLSRGGYATDPAYADKLAHLATRLQSIQSGE
jgi:flagellar protein FlgJ